MTRFIPLVAAFSGGAILSLMIALNGELSRYVSALEASWLAHGTGAVAALLLLLFLPSKRVKRTHIQAPWWAYTAGVPGALLVTFAVMTVNSFLGITGTLVLSIVGQVLFGLLCDQFGWFGLAKHPINLTRVLSTVPIVIGAVMIVIAQGALS